VNKDRDQPQVTLEPTRAIGYGSPPEGTRFQRGRSGNPKGRPRGSLNVATAFMKALRERVVINEHGQRKTVTKLEAALKQLVNKAASGELRALQQLLELARDAEAKQAQLGGNPALGELDHEVVQGIVKRFQTTEDSGQQIAEGGKDDAQSR
jgi:Family of unknown function (DUF5681)